MNVNETFRPAKEAQCQTTGRAARRFVTPLMIALVVLCFCGPLRQLAQLSATNDLYSHLPLVPLICGYLVWLRRPLFRENVSPAWIPAGVCCAAGLTLLAALQIVNASALTLTAQDRLAFLIGSFVLVVAGILTFRAGRPNCRAISFPLAFLALLIPLPTFLETALSSILQYGSAAVAHAMFQLSGVPVLRIGTIFQLPGIALEVAPQCSGIRSSLILLIASLVSGAVFLRVPLHRAVLVAVVLPLALLRNGFRVFVLGQLCIHVGPEMIDSPLHHRGGPVFFALSLVPLFGLLWLLIKIERGGTDTRTFAACPKLA